MKSTLANSALALSILALTGNSALAHGPADSDTGSLEKMVASANAIIYGTVVDIQYRNSEPTKEAGEGIPHTFVTYKIAETLRGKAASSKLTLRIPGGADGKGGIYQVSDAPQFAHGQTDVLFVGAENEDGCPIVGCVEGRFRVLDQQIYSGFGIPLQSARKELKFGGTPRFDVNVMDIPRPAFDQVMQQPAMQKFLKVNRISTAEQMEELRARYEKEAPETYQVKTNVEGYHPNDDDSSQSPAAPMEKFGKPMYVDEFLAEIREVNYYAPPPRAEVRSANAELRFKARMPMQTALKAEQTAEPKLSREEQEDRMREFD